MKHMIYDMSMRISTYFHVVHNMIEKKKIKYPANMEMIICVFNEKDPSSISMESGGKVLPI